MRAAAEFPGFVTAPASEARRGFPRLVTEAARKAPLGGDPHPGLGVPRTALEIADHARWLNQPARSRAHARFLLQDPANRRASSAEAIDHAAGRARAGVRSPAALASCTTMPSGDRQYVPARVVSTRS
jgi:hypothetical protein